MKKIAIFLLLLSPLFALAQRNCGSMDYLNEQINNDPSIELRMDQIEQATEAYLTNNNNLRAGTITIPVVVHVVYKTNGENISDAQIQSQIDVLNEDFRRTNADADNTWGQAADSGIEFCLASVDPNGNPTNGITRTSTRKRSFGTNDDMKRDNKGGKSPWPASDYLNVWSCNIQRENNCKKKE